MLPLRKVELSVQDCEVSQILLIRNTVVLILWHQQCVLLWTNHQNLPNSSNHNNFFLHFTLPHREFMYMKRTKFEMLTLRGAFWECTKFWIWQPEPYKSDVVVYTCYSSNPEVEYQKLKIVFNYITSLRQIWAMWDCHTLTQVFPKGINHSYYVSLKAIFLNQRNGEKSLFSLCVQNSPC